MDQNRESQLKLYSLGIVVKDKPRITDAIEVVPIEDMSLEKGSFSDSDRNVNVSFQDHRGVQKKASLKGGSIIKATWYRRGASNRATSPDVIAGETVEIYRFADDPTYYWDDCKRENKLRRLETVRYVFSNQSSGREPADDDSSYWVEFSTHDKTIKLHTSNNDGEAAKYDLVIDCGKGILSLVDNMDNTIELNSVNGVLTGELREKISLNTKAFEINASESFVVNTKTSNITADTHTTKATSITEDGTVSITEGMSVKSSSGGSVCSIEGNIEAEGSLKVVGGGEFGGTVSAPNIQ